MRAKNIVYTRASDGGVSIVLPMDKSTIEKVLGPMTDEQYEQHIWEKGVPQDAITPISVDESDFPEEKDFWDALKQDGKKLIFDLDKAKNIQLDRVRIAREPKLLELDKQFMLALEKGEDTKNIAAEKQALRDITEPLKNLSASNIDDIKNAFPESLKS